MIDLKKAELAALVAHASTDTTRLHLNSVFFDAPRGAVAATDGHRLVIRHGEKFGPKRFLFLCDDLKSVLRSMKNKDTARISPKEIKIGKITHSMDPVAAEFPPFETVLAGYTEKTKGSVVTLNASYLLDVAAHVRAIRSDTHVYPLSISTRAEMDPAELYTKCNGVTWVFTIMPLMWDSGDAKGTWSSQVKASLKQDQKLTDGRLVKGYKASKKNVAKKVTKKRPAKKASKKTKVKQ